MSLPLRTALRDSRSLRFARCLALALVGLVRYSPSTVHAQPTGDYADIRAEYVSYQLDVEPLPSDTRIAALRAEMGAVGNFTDLVYESTQTVNSVWAYNDHASRLAALARAWAGPSHPLYHDPVLLTEIRTSIDWFWADHVPANNWWHNEIGIPTSFAILLSLLWEELSATQRANAVTILKRARLHSWSASSLPMLGANRLWRAQVSLIESAFTANATLAQTEATATSNTLVRTTGEGIKHDNSFHQHSLQLYNGGYGQVQALAGAAILRQLRNTPWALPTEKQDLLIDYLLDGTRWMIHGPWFNDSTIGREITREDNGGNPARTVSALKLLRDPGHARAAAIEAFLAHLEQTAGAQPGLVTGARHFPRSDFTVFRRSTHALSVKALSNRTHCQEAGNGENVRGVHLSHGAAFYYTDGLDYHGIVPVWDWKKIPGTTVANNALFADIDPPIQGTTAFVGAVTDGERAATTYRLDHNNSGRLQARKSWFLFDGALVALGAGITYSSTSHEIITTLEQRILGGPIRVSDSLGERDLPNGNATLTGARWLLHESTGYFLPAATTLNVQKGPRSGRWSDTSSRERDDLITLDTLGLWQSHGLGATGSNGYAYAILPDSTITSLQAAAIAPPFTVISNTVSIQAVHHPGSSTTGFIFHAAGSATIPGGPTVSVDRPCALLVRPEGDGWRVTGSDPGAGTGVLTVTVSGIGALALTLPSGNDTGGSVGGLLSLVPTPPVVTITSPRQDPAALVSSAPYLVLDAEIRDTIPAGQITGAAWEMVSGPAPVAFFEISQLIGGPLPGAWAPSPGGSVQVSTMTAGIGRGLAGARFAAPGDYVLRLTVASASGDTSETLGVRVGSPAPFAPPSDAALFWLRLDEGSGATAENSLAGGGNGTYVGSVALGQAGAIAATGSAVGLGGVSTSNYVEFPPSSNLTTRNGTVALWFKTSSATVQTLFYGSDATTGDLYGNENETSLGLNAAGKLVGSVFFGGGSSSANITVASTGNYANGQWHHVAMTWQEGGNLSLEMDGGVASGGESASVAYTIPSASHYAFSALMRLGRTGSGPNAGNRRFIGSVDDAHAFSRPLAVQERAAVRSAAGNFAPAPVAGPHPSLGAPGNATLVGSITDDGTAWASLATQWVSLAGPGTVSIATPSALSSDAGFASAGSYVIALLGNDGIATTFAVTEVGVGTPGATFASWIVSLQNPPPLESRGPLDDPDRDGTANLLEYGFDLDPMVAETAPAMVAAIDNTIPGGPWLVFTFRRSLQADSLVVTPMTSSTLGGWSEAPVDGVDVVEEILDADVDGDGSAERVRLRIRIPEGAPRLFVRLRVVELP